MSRRARLDRVCADAIEPARAAAEETGDGVGEHLEVLAEDDRVVTHFFDCTLPGYHGWRWAVVVARAPRARTVTICETALLPGPDALTAPQWVPWSQRLRAGDVGIGDLLPTDEFDERLQPAYVMSDDDAVEDIALELGVGRKRVMTREGRMECAQRWYDGDRGPDAEISQSAPDDARCGTCGFYLPMAGSLRLAFGVCGNFYAIDDAKVVSADHGCGAHSEVLADAEGDDDIDAAETVYDDAVIEPVDVSDEDSVQADAETFEGDVDADAVADGEATDPVEDSADVDVETDETTEVKVEVEVGDVDVIVTEAEPAAAVEPEPEFESEPTPVESEPTGSETETETEKSAKD
ncbi:hypothetical protein STSO111631_21905 [Stackebrandtia soli]